MTLVDVNPGTSPVLSATMLADIRGRLMMGEAQAEDIAAEYGIAERDLWRLVDRPAARPKLVVVSRRLL